MAWGAWWWSGGAVANGVAFVRDGWGMCGVHRAGGGESGRDVRRLGRLTVLFFRGAPRLACVFHRDLAVAFGEDRGDLFEGGVAVGDPA